jgi:hypothetical protein
MSSASDVSRWLHDFLAKHGGIAGTVHMHREEGMLALCAAHNIPEQVQKATALVPNGKGMAGLALQQGKPITTCNLQTDSSGNVRPGARAVNAQAAAALPVRDMSGRVRAVVGIAFLGERDLNEDDLATLSRAAHELPG